MKIAITIDIDNNGKETKAQRRVRIAESENGRKLRTRSVPDKRRKKLDKARRGDERREG